MRKESYIDKVKEIELCIANSQLALQTKKPKNHPTHYSVYQMFCHPDAIQYIEIGDMLMLREFNSYEIKFFYNLNIGLGSVETRESVLTRMESNLWSCEKHNFERILPPLHNDYILRCKVCSAQMRILQVAPFPILREKIRNLPEFVEVKNVREKTETIKVEN